jgi:hypothetical protein
MTYELFSESTVQEHYDKTVAQQSERRVFNIPEEDLCARSIKRHVDGIVTMYCPGRLLLDPEMHAASPEAAGGKTFTLRRWMEFTGSVRLLQLQPRQRYSTPPRVDRILPPSAGRAGQIIIERVVRTSEEMQETEKYVARQFQMIREYVDWVNDDLEYYEQSTRNWLWSLIEAKKRRLCPGEASDDDEAESWLQAGDDRRAR